MNIDEFIEQVRKERGEGYLKAMLALYGSVEKFYESYLTRQKAEVKAEVEGADTETETEKAEADDNIKRLILKSKIKNSLSLSQYLTELEKFTADMTPYYSRIFLNAMLTPYRIATFFAGDEHSAYLSTMQIDDVAIRLYVAYLKRNKFIFYSYIPTDEYRKTTLHYMHKLASKFSRRFSNNNLIHSVNRHAYASYLVNYMSLDDLSLMLGHTVKVMSGHYVNDSLRIQRIEQALKVLLKNDQYRSLVRGLI